MRAEIIRMLSDGRRWLLVREKDIQFRPDRSLLGLRLDAVSLDLFQDHVPGISWDQVLVGIEMQGAAVVPDHIVELAIYNARRKLILSRSGLFSPQGFVPQRNAATFMEEMRKLVEEYAETNIASYLRNEAAYCEELESILRRRGLQ